MAGKTLSYFNLTGGLNTVQTMATINSTPNRTESPDMVNVEYFKLSGLKTMKGNVGLNHSNPLTDNKNYQPINFGYEYIKGNNRYMIVANRRNLYEYDPVNDVFTLLNLSPEVGNEYTFYTAGEGITICGFANGIVAASPVNNYLVYYRKGRGAKLGTASVTNSNKVTVDSYTSAGATCTEDILGRGDLITIDGVEYEVLEVQPAEIQDENDPSSLIPNPDKDTFTITVTISSTISSKDLNITDFTKIPCEYVSKIQKGNKVETTTTEFLPTVVQSHQGRLWVAAKINDQEVAAYLIHSDLGSIHNTFEGGDATTYDAGYFEEFWEDTSDITALGTWDKYVVLHKREHTYLINTSNSDATTWNVESYSDYTCDNQQGFVKANNGYYTYCSTAGGIYPMIQRTIYSAINQGTDASIKIRDTFLNLNTYALDEIYAVYHPYKKYIMFYMPMIGESGSNNCYILDLQTKSWLHRRIPQKVCTAFEFDSKVYIGTTDGKIYEEFRGLDFDGEPIQFSWKSPWFIWGNGTNWTTTREIRVKMSQEGTNNFFVRNRRDGAEAYKERTITNTSSKVDGIVWDEKYLTEDKTDGYIETTPVYSYTFHEGEDDEKIYYSLESPLDEHSLMFEDLPTTMSIIGGIPNGALAYKQEVNEGDPYDSVEAGQDTAYAFKYTPTQSKYKCYRSTQDSNIKAWITLDDTSTAIVNVIDKTNITKYLRFKFRNIGGGWNSLFIKETDYNTYWNTPNRWIPAYFEKDGNVSVHESGNLSLWIWTNSNPNSGNIPVDRIVYIRRSNDSDLPYGDHVERESAENDRTIDGGTSEVWNGKSTRSGKTKSVSYYSTSYITIDGVRFNRYSQGDEGSIVDTSQNPEYVYGRTPTLTKNQRVYNETLTTDLGYVSAVSGTNYTIGGKVFVPDDSKNKYGLGTRWFLTSQMFANGTSGTSTGSSASAMYLYPVGAGLFYGDETKFLTDTKWDESTWINTGQITKRFPIDRQYFQTLQLEFCGETINQGIELYGFEVDGIQLTEVPW